MRKRSGHGVRRGQTTLEFLMTFGLVMFMITAIIHISLICCTKLITNYSAWIGARVWAVNKTDPTGKARDAALRVATVLNWGVSASTVEVKVETANEGVEVNYKTPLGIPLLLTNDSSGRITCRAYGAVARDPLVGIEVGDNKED